VRYIPHNGPGTTAQPPAQSSAGSRRPRVCVVWSNSLSQIFGGASFVVPAVVEAAAQLDVELVLALSDEDADRLGPVPPSVTVLRRFPLNLLLPGASAVVHHGGAGCLMTAVAAGVPQLALPFGAEQEMIARRLAGSGAGTVIRGSAADAGSIAAALRDLLGTNGYRSTAASLAAENAAAPTPVALVAQLEALAVRAEPALAGALPSQ